MFTYLWNVCVGLYKLSYYEKVVISIWIIMEIMTFLTTIIFIYDGIQIMNTPIDSGKNVLVLVMFYFLCIAMFLIVLDKYNFIRRGMFVYHYKDVRTIIHLARIFRADSHIPIYFRTRSGSYMFYSDAYDYTYNTTFVITREENNTCGIVVYEFYLLACGNGLPECKVKWYDKESGKHCHKYISSNEAFQCIFPQ